MGATIDERIVEMRFDNKQFEAGAKQSLSTLQRLKEALNFSSSKKSLGDLQSSVKSVDLSGIQSAVESLNQRFSTFGIIGMRVITNIVDSIQGKLVKAIASIQDSIIQGGIRRATNIEKARFQLQSIIGDEVKVQAVLDAASDSVNGTAYSFDVAAKAASQFYASGITESDTMAGALRGLAGATATFSADYESMAMIWAQVAGKGRLMGDELLQLSSRGMNAASTIAKYMNNINNGSIEASDNMKAMVQSITGGLEVTEGDIREFTSKGKINFEIFSQAMSETFGDAAKKANETFDGALANIKAALARIGAGFVSPLVAQNSKIVELFNSVREKVNDVKAALVFDEQLGNVDALSKQFSDAVLSMAGDLSVFVKNLDVKKPMEILIHGVESVKNVVKGFGTILKPVGKSFRDIFLKDVDINLFVDLAASIEKVTEKFRISEKSSKDLKDTFDGLFSVARLLLDGIISLIKIFIPFSDGLNSASEGVLSFTGSIGRSLVKITEMIRSSTLVSTVFDEISRVVEIVTDKIKSFSKSFDDFSILESVVDSLASAFVFLAGGAKKVFDILKGGFSLIGPSVVKIINSLASAIRTFAKTLSDTFRTNGFNGLYDLVNSGIIAALGVGLSKLILDFDSFTNGAKEMVTGTKGIFGKIKGSLGKVGSILDDVRKSLSKYQDEINAKILKEIAISVGILAASLAVISFINPERLNKSLGALTILLGDLFVSFAGFQKIMIASIPSIVKLGTSLITLSVSVLILSSALVNISRVDPERLNSSMIAISLLIGELTAVSVILGKYGSKVKTGAIGIIAFSAAIYILTSSVQKLGDLDSEKLAKGLAGVGALLAELALFMAASNFGKLKPSQAIGIIGLSAALLILQEAVSRFGDLDTTTLTKGISAIGFVLSEIALFNFAAGESKGVLKTAVSMVIFAKAMEMLVVPLRDMGTLNEFTIAKGLIAMAGALTAIVAAMNLMPKNSLVIATGLVIVAKSVGMISDSMSSMGSMSWEEIAKGIVALAGSLTILTVAMNLMKGTLGGSAAMLVMATSLRIFLPVMTVLGGMSWESIAKGIVALASAFVVLGAAGAILGPLVPSILGLAGALSLLGVAVAAFGAGIFAFSLGLTTLAASGIAGAAALVEVIKILTVGILQTISDSLELFVKAAQSIILAICEALKVSAPEIVDTLGYVVLEVLNALSKYIPPIVEALIELIVGVLDSLTSELPKLVDSIVNVFVQFFASISESIKKIDTKILEDALIGVEIMAAVMIALAALSALAPAAMKGVLDMGIVLGELSLLIAAAGLIYQIPGLDWLIGEGGDFLQSIGTAIGKFIGGIVGGGMAGIASQLPGIGESLSSFMESVQGFVDGASKIGPETMDGVSALAKTVLLLTGAEIVEGLTKWFTGKSSLASFGEELASFGPTFAKFASDISGVNAGVVSAASNAALSLAEMASKLPNSGGLAAKIMGDNKLSDFGKELEAFGPYISAYATSVAGLNPGVVEASANAALALSNMASKLPNSGGLAAKIMGDNKLSDFGKELEAFGPYISAYATSVSGLDAGVVTASAAAAQAMAELATNLPNSGGLVSIFTGDNKLSDFGREMAAFGVEFKAYADSVYGVNAGSVTTSVRAVTQFINLSKEASSVDSGGLKNLLDTMNSFGGNAITNFLNSFSNATPTLKATITTLVSGAISSFLTRLGDFTKAGSDSVNAYISSFKNKYSEAQSTARTLATNLITMLQLKVAEFGQKGTASANSYLNAIKALYGVAIITGTQLAANAYNGVNSKTSQFSNIGHNAAQNFVSGLQAYIGNASGAGKQLANAAHGGVGYRNGDFYQVGKDAGQGFVNGLESMMDASSSAGRKIANAAYNAAKRTLREKSPSKRMFEVGDFAGIGFINGLIANFAKSYHAGEGIAETMVDGLKESFAHNDEDLQNLLDIDLSPTITPKVDLTNVVASGEEIANIFNQGIKTGIGSVSSTSQAISRRNATIEAQNLNAQVDTENLRPIEYKQYISSPKYLSRIDIYRQTKNLLNQNGEVVNK